MKNQADSNIFLNVLGFCVKTYFWLYHQNNFKLPIKTTNKQKTYHEEIIDV